MPNTRDCTTDGHAGLGELEIRKAHARFEIARAPQASRENIMDGHIGLGKLEILSARASPRRLIFTFAFSHLKLKTVS